MITPYDYQKKALQKLKAHLAVHTTALLVMATGLGKSYVAAFLARDLIKKGRGLILCHDSDILKQVMEDFQDVLDDTVSMGIFYGQQKDTEEVDILFATFQTFREWKNAFFEDEFHFVFVDEGHHSEADTFRPVIDYFNPKVLLGMTATPDRMDGREIRDIFGEEVVHIGLEEAIANGYLADVEYHVLSDGLDTKILKKLLREINAGDKHITIKQLNETIFIRRRDEEVANIIKDYNKKSILFCENIAHVETMAVQFPGAVTFHSQNSAEQNQEALRKFKAGEAQYILSVNKFNEGKDVPDAELVTFLRSTDSKNIFFQQLGRGLRKCMGKDKIIVLDFVANCDRVIIVEQMVERIAKIRRTHMDYDKDELRLDGTSFNFVFSDDVRDAIEIIRAVQTKLYISDIPHLLAEYDLKRNSEAPELVRARTSKKLYWKCSECDHDWIATGQSRAGLQKSGCPACANHVVTPNNCLATTHPELAKEFHPTKNSPLTAQNFPSGSNKKLWWLCSKCKHEWKAVINNRTKLKKGCPACANHVVTPNNCLATTHPELAKEFHPTKNSPLTAKDVTAGTAKKLWWKCSQCGYERKTSGHNRLRQKSKNCPACANHVVTPNNCLATTHPELAKEFHPTKNSPLTAKDVTAGTDRKLWWKCLVCNYEWRTPGYSRSGGRKGECPACVNQVVTPNNCLATTHPELAKEFHPTKNSPLTIWGIIAGTNKKLWWKCSVCDHEWQARGNQRTHKQHASNCPICAHRRGAIKRERAKKEKKPKN